MKQWKSFFAGVLATVLLIGLFCTAYATTGSKTVTADYNNIKVTLDGKQVNLVDVNGNPVEPFAISGTTYLPIRAVSNALGLDVDWDGATATVILSTPEASKSVYITRTGKKYHYDNHCNGGTYWAVPMDTALGFGLQPCDKCVLLGN